MTFIAESKISSAACARYYGVGDDISLNSTSEYVLKPQNSATWGSPGNWSYNSATGLFTLSNSHIYLIEADINAGRVVGVSINGSVLSMLTDQSGTELPDSCRGHVLFISAQYYYRDYTKVADQTNFAIIDGSSITGFYWKVQEIERNTNSGTVYLNYTAGNGAGTFGTGESRLVIREYPK